MNNSSSNMLRAGIKVLVIIVLIGFSVCWIVRPTKTYKQIWMPEFEIQLNSTYFGFQGINFLIYFFPVIFVAVLGCVYLHVGKNRSYNNIQLQREKQLLSRWRKPMIVKGPLGIVSGIEVAFLLMFIALLTWSTSSYLHYYFHYTITPHSDATLWKLKLERSGLTLGVVGNICLTFLFFPVARGSSVLPLFGLTSEGSIKYHIWLGHFVMVFFTAHGVCYIIYWALTNQIYQMVKWDKAQISNVAGEISLVAGLGLWATTFPRIRRKMFELFFYTHHLYILFMVFYLLHVIISFSTITLPGFYLFLIDRYLRFLQSRPSVRVVSARILRCQTLEINFDKSTGLSYNPTSILFINVPTISKLQWHPFTITSNSNLEHDKLSVVIKSEGSWSQKLYQILSSPSSIDHLQISVEGPYGPASTHFLRHDTLVMVSGGSGITPFISIIRELIFACTRNECKLPQVTLICSFKNSSDLAMLDLLLPISGSSISISNLDLKIEASITREKEPTIDNDSKLLRTIWFKPQSTDTPVSAILGPNSWLWLGAIISSSFLIFLIIIGLITRYYIYPTNPEIEDFSYSLRTFLNMLVICISIAMTASAAVLWNKKQNLREIKQIRNIAAGTIPRGTTAGLWADNSEREMESLPHESFVQAINVTYGERPDLKRMLFECKGSSVGVLASGPKKMRHEVATICSSGLADNLHFESISFSW